MESKSSNNADAETRLHNENTLKNLKPGDLIKIHRNFYKHRVVNIGQEEGVEKYNQWDIVAGTKFRPSFFAKTIWDFTEIEKVRKIPDSGETHITTDSFWPVVGNSEAENGKNKDLENGNIDNSKVVIRAKILRTKTEQGQIWRQFYNSEHLATWDRYLEPKTPSEGRSNATDKSTLNLDQPSTNDMNVDKIKEHNTQLLDTLEIGDLIKFSRRFYYHWAVYIGKDGDTDDATPKVIHRWDPNDFSTSKKGASIMTTSFWEAAGNSKAEKGNLIDLETGTINGEQVAARAAARQSLVENELLTDKYNRFFNNSEQFAKWCRYGMDDVDKVQESPREHQRVFSEIEDQISEADSEHSYIDRKWIHENLTKKEQLKLLQTKVKKIEEFACTLEDMEKRRNKRDIVEGIVLIGCATIISLSGGRFGKVREGLRLLKSTIQKLV